jgi:hypothetical protein
MKTYTVRLKQFGVMTGIALSGIGVSGAITPANALTFNFTPTAGTSQLAIDGFNAAGALWSSLLKDNVTVNINIDFTALSQGILAQAGSSLKTFNYSQVYNALNADKSSVDDHAAVKSLNNSSTFNMLLNRTSNNPNGSGSATPYVDNNGNANNSIVNMSSANAKALGLDSSGNDAFIAFNSGFNFDFDRSNGISAGAFDFIGIAAHEIGHALGFNSGVDLLDLNSSSANGPFKDSQFPGVNALDLFRYSAQSTANGVIDWTADKRDKYFSLDRGITKIASFSTGEKFGDGNQASHWQDDLGLGIMDPTSASGELLNITENDLRALDVIGWNRTGDNASNVLKGLNNSPIGNGSLAVSAIVANNTAEVPEPANFIGTFIFAAFGAKMTIEHKRKLFKLSNQ